jgi:hypothetical protein
MQHALARRPATLVAALLLFIWFFSLTNAAYANKRRAPAGGQRAVVVDERLAALRAEPALTAPLVQRLARGREVAILGTRRAPDGVNFYRVAVTRRTRGWLQAESVAAPARAREDARLLRLIEASTDFDQLTRARIFLEEFPRSPLRARVLLLYGTAAEEAAARLSRDAERRLREDRLPDGDAPLHSYFLNYSGLDRYRRHGVVFTFDATAKRFRYDGAAWRELLRRHPRSPEATEARRRLDTRADATPR